MLDATLRVENRGRSVFLFCITSIYGKVSGGSNIADLSLALYRYGHSAVKYNESKDNEG